MEGLCQSQVNDEVEKLLLAWIKKKGMAGSERLHNCTRISQGAAATGDAGYFLVEVAGTHVEHS